MAHVWPKAHQTSVRVWAGRRSVAPRRPQSSWDERSDADVRALRETSVRGEERPKQNPKPYKAYRYYRWVGRVHPGEMPVKTGGCPQKEGCPARLATRPGGSERL